MELERYFMGLADRTRLRILNLLLQGELCGCDVQYVLGASQSNVSRHLNYLKRAGLVADRRDGYRVYYRLSAQDASASAKLFGYLKDAFKADKSFGADVKALKRAIRHGACQMEPIQKATPNPPLIFLPSPTSLKRGKRSEKNRV